MELEEAKTILNKMKRTLDIKAPNVNIRNNDLLKFQAIEAVLQALDNSIPKEKVLEKMKKLDDLANDPKQEYYYANYRYTMNALADLLGEDSSNTVTEIFRSKARLAPIEMKDI